MPSVWTRLRAAFNPVARAFNAYTAYRLHPDEHVDTTFLPLGIHDARHVLRESAYRPQYLSAAKRHPDTDALHDLSYRRVPTTHPVAAEGTRIGREYRPRDCQYHVHAFERGDGVIDWFSHYETRPMKAPIEHYRPEPGETYLRGVTDLPL